jgi:hypothetical protein
VVVVVGGVGLDGFGRLGKMFGRVSSGDGERAGGTVVVDAVVNCGVRSREMRC